MVGHTRECDTWEKGKGYPLGEWDDSGIAPGSEGQEKHLEQLCLAHP